jgi:hypothetical protein
MGLVTFDQEYKGRQVRAEIEIVQASALDAITRTRLMFEAGPFPFGETDAAGKVIRPATPREVDSYMLRKTIYPDCISTATGWVEVGAQRYDLPDLPYPVFEGLPFMLLVNWQNEVYAVNPDLLPGAAEDQKKASPSGSPGSVTSTTRRKTRKTTASPNTST